jgi:hypothetical protein
MQPGDRQIRPSQVKTHQPGKKDPNKHGHKCQAEILLPDYFVIETEYMFSDETCRRPMVRYRM